MCKSDKGAKFIVLRLKVRFLVASWRLHLYFEMYVQYVYTVALLYRFIKDVCLLLYKTYGGK